MKKLINIKDHLLEKFEDKIKFRGITLIRYINMLIEYNLKKQLIYKKINT